MNEPMDPKYKYFYEDEGFGPAIHTQVVPAETIERYRGKLPDQMLKYWSLYGWSGYGDGIFWTVNPDEFKPVVDAWLAGTHFQDNEEHYAIGMGAFGKLYLWGTHSGQNVTISPTIGSLFPRDQREKIKAGMGDFLAKQFFSGMDKKNVDQTDESGRPLFQRALKKLGPLKPGEIYGFVPAPVLGGRPDLAHVQKVDAVTYLVMLAQMGERKVMADIVQVAQKHGLIR